MDRSRRLIALVASVAVVGGSAGCTSLATDEPREPSSGLTADVSLQVSGSGVGSQPFGTDADEVVAEVAARLGEPDDASGPQEFFRIPGQDGWFEVADDPISPSWPYPVVSRSCWDALCVIFGGDDADALRLRGWELAAGPGREALDVHLAGTGIRLGDSWKRLRAAYPETAVGGAEGASLAVLSTPWTGIFDGAAAWRLSGQWDHTRPHHVPAGAVVTRLSGGEGPEPGCC
jgi:hypothetical protein